MLIKAGLSADNHFNVARRSAEAQRILLWMLEDWKARGVHFIGFAGDFIDGPMNEKERAWMIDYADACAEVAPTLFIMGNHSPEFALRCLRGRQTKYPVIVEEGAGVHVVETDAGPLAVVGVSYPYKAKLLAMTGPTSVEDTNLIAEGELRKIFLGLGVKVRELNLPTVALIHGAWRGSKIGPDQPDRPLGIEIPISDMGQLGAGGYCVGHVHLAQETSWENSPIWTPSAPIFTDYGEAGHFKGYIFAEADSETKKVTFTRVPTPVTPMVLMEYKWEDGMFLRATVKRPGQDGDPLNGEQLHESHYDAQGVDFRFRYHYSKEFAAAAKNAADEVKATLSAAGAVNVTLDPKLIPTTRAKIPGLSTATKIEDKLRLYWESTENIPSAAVALQIVSGLHELQDELAAAGYTITGAGRTAPRIKKVQWKDFFKFPGKHEIDFERLGELVTIIAPNECLAGGTLVDVPRDLRKQPDGIPIRDLVGTSPLVYSYDGERLVVARASNVRKTGMMRPVFRVKFTAEPKRLKRGLLPPMEITATEDHPFMLRDGSYRLVRDLEPGDSLMPLYRNKEGAYIQIHRNDGTLEDEHRMVGSFLNGSALLTSDHAHHDDENTWNNSENNIKVLTASAHATLHGTMRPPTYNVHPRGMAGKQHTDEVKAQIKSSLANHWTPARRRERAETFRKANPQAYQDKATLERLYLEEGLSSRKIAARLDTSFSNVLNAMRHHGIQRRNKRAANHTVVSVEFAGYEDVYDLEVPEFHNFVANGVVVHNCGKTILLQLMSAGVNYGTTPTRGSLDDLSIAKDSFIEVTQDLNGDEYILTQNCNGLSRSGTVGLIKNGNRNDPELSRAGRAEYKAWASTNLIPQNLYDSVICQSGTESVIDQKDGPRTELLLRVLGLEILELLAEAARKRAKGVSDELGRVRAVIAELQSGQTIAFCEQSLARVTDKKRVADEALRLGELTLKDLQAKNTATETQRIEYDALVLRKAELESQEAKLRERVADLDERIKNNGDILRKADDIRAAPGQVAANAVQIAEMIAREHSLTLTQTKNEGEINQLKRCDESLKEKREALDRSITNAAKAVVDKERVLTAVNEAARLVGEHKAAQIAEKAAIRAVEDLHVSMGAANGVRILGMRETLTVISHGAAEPVGLAGSALDRDSEAEKATAEAPEQLAVLGQQANAASSEVARLYRALEDQRATAARLPEIQAAETLSAESADAMVQVDADILANAEAQSAKTGLINESAKSIETLALERQTLEAKQPALQVLASREAPLAEAEAKIKAYEEERGRIDTEHSGILASMAVSGEKVEPPPIIPLLPYETAVAEARAEANRCQSAFTLAEKALTDAQARETRRQELAAQVSRLENTQAIWTRLGLDLGKDALQKAEIGESAQQLTEITNELLSTAGDNRHSVSISTERLHSNKKDMVPSLNIDVFDSVEGITKEARLLSDAGKVMVGWPFALALIVLGCERAGIAGPTIFIDEATGPCDSENAPRCVAMLRHFAQRLRSQVIFIAQQPDVSALADSAIRINDDGTISVE